MYLRVNADFFFCVLVVFPSFCTSWRSLCRLDVDESSFVASQTPSIRDILTPKLNEVPCLLFTLKFKFVGLLNVKNHAIRVSKQALTHCSANLRRNSIPYYQIWKTDTNCLYLQFQWKFSLYFFADWSLTFATQVLLLSVLRTDDTPPIVVIGLQAIFMTGHKQR